MATSFSPEVKKTKFSLDHFKQPSIKILVGANEVEFNVAKHPICLESEFFVAACSTRWSSGQEGVVRLVEDDPKIFGMFLSWLITRDLGQAEDLVDEPPKKTYYVTVTEPLKQKRRRYDQLVQCYILGNTLQALNFQNAAMDLILSTTKPTTAARIEQKLRAVGYAPEQVTMVYKNTMPNAPLRRFLVDGIVCLTKEELHNSIPDLTTTEGAEYVKDTMGYAYDLGIALDLPLGYSGKPWDADVCKYHEHPGAAKGYSCSAGMKEPSIKPLDYLGYTSDDLTSTAYGNRDLYNYPSLVPMSANHTSVQAFRNALYSPDPVSAPNRPVLPSWSSSYTPSPPSLAPYVSRFNPNPLDMTGLSPARVRPFSRIDRPSYRNNYPTTAGVSSRSRPTHPSQMSEPGASSTHNGLRRPRPPQRTVGSREIPFQPSDQDDKFDMDKYVIMRD